MQKVDANDPPNHLWALQFMKYKWLHPYFGEKVSAEPVPINPEHILLSMVGMEEEIKTLGGRHNRKQREKLQVIIKEMATILNANY